MTVGLGSAETDDVGFALACSHQPSFDLLGQNADIPRMFILPIPLILLPQYFYYYLRSAST